jgi:sugar lactone lactonase YvrE
MRNVALWSSLLVIAAPSGAAAIDINGLEMARASAARELAAGHFEQARSTYEALSHDVPGYPSIQLGLADSLVGLGLSSEAEAVYRELIDEGFGGMVLDGNAFARLLEQPGYQDLKTRAQAQTVSNARAREAFEIAEQKFIAEGLAYDPRSRRFFASSSYLRKVVAREPDGRLADFVPSASHGLLQALGMKVDTARSRLLVITAVDDARLVHFHRRDLGRSGVAVYDLVTGRLERMTWLTEGGLHLFNDLVLTSDGSAYITDSDAGRIYRLSADAARLTPVTRPGALLYPNGIDIEPSERRLFVADLRGVYSLDLDGGELVAVPHAKTVSAVGIDGLYLHGDDLIGVQSFRKLDRVMVFHLSRDHRQIESAEALDSADPRLTAATEGVVVGDELYFIANSFQDAVDDKGFIAKPESTAPTLILALQLPHSR